MNPPAATIPATPGSLTIVVVALVGGDALERCLRSTAGIPARRIVIGSREVTGFFQGDTADIEYLESGAPVPVRRAMGVAAAATEWVAIIEDTCEISATWHEAFVHVAVATSGPAWAGPVRLVRELAPRFMALACTEYGEFTPGNWRRLARAAEPGGSWRMARIPGICLTYRRAAISGLLAGELVESDLHAELEARGSTIHLHPGLEVTYCVADARNATIATRFAHGRIYGGGLARRSSLVARLVGAIKCLALPPVMLARAARGLPDDYGRRATALAWVCCFAGAWSAGELTGLLTGRRPHLRAWA